MLILFGGIPCFPCFLFLKLCASVWGFCVWLPLGQWKRKLYIYTVLFSLSHVSDLHPLFASSNLCPFPFYVFVVTNYPCLCCQFLIGDITGTVVTFCSLFQVEKPLEYFLQCRFSGDKFPQLLFVKSSFFLHIERVILLDILFLAGTFPLSVVWIFGSTLFWFVEFLLRSLMITWQTFLLFPGCFENFSVINSDSFNTICFREGLFGLRKLRYSLCFLDLSI